MPIYAHESKEDFLAEGFDLTILNTIKEQQDCCICLRPIYKAECDGDHTTHDHGPETGSCSSESKSKINTAASNISIGNEVPEIGMKIKACGHELGYFCALELFKHKGSCPLCRKKLFPTDGDEWEELIAQALAQLELERTSSEDFVEEPPALPLWQTGAFWI